MEDRQEAKNAKGSTNEPSERLDDLAHRVIGAAIEVHRHLGRGFVENPPLDRSMPVAAGPKRPPAAS